MLLQYYQCFNKKSETLCKIKEFIGRNGRETMTGCFFCNEERGCKLALFELKEKGIDIVGYAHPSCIEKHKTKGKVKI